MNQESFSDVLRWLHESNLTTPGRTYTLDPHSDATIRHGGNITLSLPVEQVKRHTPDELKKLRDKYGSHFGEALNDKDRLQKIWEQSRNPYEALEKIDFQRVPADALAFYRQFHLTPSDSWGIYLVVPRILRHLNVVTAALGNRLAAFTPETLATAVLFEIFHHEFFHHLVECLATDLEMFFGGRPIYWPYCEGNYEAQIGKHRHHPLEEALANCYAYNSLSFISRVKTGYRDACISMYQKALTVMWRREPAGYCDAGNYTEGGFADGGGQLIRMLLAANSPPSPRPAPPFSAIAESGLPGGHTAYFSKPTIPTYLIGTRDELSALMGLVPAPLEACTNLFWPGKTDTADGFIIERRKALKASKIKQPGE